MWFGFLEFLSIFFRFLFQLSIFFSATLRECFPTRVLLGSITDPLVPFNTCQQRDITDDSSGSIYACLCNTDFCNDDDSTPFGPLEGGLGQTGGLTGVAGGSQDTRTTTTRWLMGLYTVYNSTFIWAATKKSKILRIPSLNLLHLFPVHLSPVQWNHNQKWPNSKNFKFI